MSIKEIKVLMILVIPIITFILAGVCFAIDAWNPVTIGILIISASLVALEAVLVNGRWSDEM